MPRRVRTFNRLSWLSRPERVALILTFVTVIIRCCSLLHNYTPEKNLVPDSPTYEDPAKSFLDTGSFVESDNFPVFFASLYGSAPSTEPRPMFMRTPGYPLFIAAAYRLGAGRRGLLLIQILLSGLAVWLTYSLGNQLISAWAGVLAALLIAVDPATVWASQVMLPDSLFSLLAIAVALVGVALLRRPGRWWAICLGILLGAATLVKPISYYLAVPVCAVLWYFGVPRKFVAGALASVLLLIGGWQLRNLKVLGTSSFSGIQSVNLLLWRGAGIVAQQRGLDLESAQKIVITMLPDPARLSAAEVNQAYASAGVRIIRSHPILYLGDMAKGLIVILFSPGPKLLPAYFGLPLVLFSVTYAIMLLSICAAALIQAAAMWRNCEVPVHVFVAAIAIYLLVVAAGADTVFRYRVPIMPFLAIYGTAGILRMWRRLGGSHQTVVGRSPRFSGAPTETP